MFTFSSGLLLVIKKKNWGGGVGNVQTLKPFELNFSDGPAKHSVSKLFINLI